VYRTYVNLLWLIVVWLVFYSVLGWRCIALLKLCFALFVFFSITMADLGVGANRGCVKSVAVTL